MAAPHEGSMRILMVAVVAALPMVAAEITSSSAPLVSAIKSGKRETAIGMIAKKSADVNAAEADGSTPLLWAAHMNDADLVARLVKAGAKPNVGNKLGST